MVRKEQAGEEKKGDKKREVKAGLKKVEENADIQDFSSLASYKYMLSKVIVSSDDISTRLLSMQDIDL